MKILNINTDISTVGGSTTCLLSLHNYFLKEKLDSRIFTAGKFGIIQALKMVKYAFFCEKYINVLTNYDQQYTSQPCRVCDATGEVDEE